MPATKTSQYSENQVQKSKIGRALAHPARLQIIEFLISNLYTRNSDLCVLLNLSQPSVSNHIQKLLDASLVELRHNLLNEFTIVLKSGFEEKMRGFVDELIER